MQYLLRHSNIFELSPIVKINSHSKVLPSDSDSAGRLDFFLTIGTSSSESITKLIPTVRYKLYISYHITPIPMLQ